MHILYHRLSKALALEGGPTPPKITAPTMQMAIAFVEAPQTIKGISEIVSIASYFDCMPDHTNVCRYCMVPDIIQIPKAILWNASPDLLGFLVNLFLKQSTLFSKKCPHLPRYIKT